MVNHSLEGLDLFGQSERRYHQKECCSQLGAVGTNKVLGKLLWRFHSIILSLTLSLVSSSKSTQ